MKKLFIISLLVLTALQFAVAGNDKFSAGKMVAGGQVGLSALGLGFGANFEFGITNSIGIMPSFIIHNYTAGTQEWSFKVIDLYGTYHYKPGNSGFFSGEKVDTYGMLGISWVAFGAQSGSSKEETSSSIAFGGGAGGRYYFTDKLSAFGEGKYRFASFKTDSYTLSLAWYSIYVGVSYAIN